MNIKSIKIANRIAGPGRPCFIIAEAGVNHNGDIRIAKKLVDAATKAGADAVKFQTFKTESMISRNAPKAEYQKRTTGQRGSQFEMIKKLELSARDHRAIQAQCKKRGIIFLSTPFDKESADLLEKLKVPAFKIGSGEITNLPLLEHIARKQKPIILSTGMSTLKEVGKALDVIKRAGCKKIILLHCVSNYPARPQDINLKAMNTLRETFKLPVGYSDHTAGVEVSLAAAALGACVVEKHFTLDKKMKGPDHRASIEPDELAAWVNGIRTVEASLGHSGKKPAESEKKIAAVARKSLVAACDIPAGKKIKKEWIAIKRPGDGIPPGGLSRLLGKKTARVIKKDEKFCWKTLI